MPTGDPYFAWIDASETTFGPEHLRWDESVFSFTLSQEEGDPASLTVQIRGPHVGLLSPGRKIWAWFALDCGPDLIKFRGRLVGIPTSMFEELVTLEFVARPFDVVAQKEALAESLRVLPYYDEAVIDPARRNDPEVVLEGYTKIWHYNRETPATEAITVSDEITGEDGLVELLCVNGDILYDGLSLSLTSGPLARVDVNAEFTWTQQASGTVDLTGYLVKNWPRTFGGEINLNAGDWPKVKTGIGDGWEVVDSHAQDIVDTATHTETRGGGGIVKFGDGSTSQVTWSSSTTTLRAARNVVSYGKIVTNATSSVMHSKDGDGVDYVSSVSQSYSDSFAVIVVQAIKPTLVAGYRAERQCTEKVSFTLFADVQPILTDPEDGEALRIDDIRSVNLSEVIDGQPPIIGEPARRSYIATERGNRSLEHLIAYARAHLMKRARAVEIAFVPKLARMPEITLRKSAFVAEPRIGEATGKIIGYSVALDGSDGRIKCEVKIGCMIGYGGAVAAADGTPTYCTIDYTGPDYQVFINRVVLFPLDTSVGYQPPAADPNDDGIEFLSAHSADDFIAVPLTVQYGPEPSEDDPPTNFSGPTSSDDIQNQLEARSEWIKNVVLPSYETHARFKLKPMKGEFSTNYELQVTDLMIPTGINLEAI